MALVARRRQLRAAHALRALLCAAALRALCWHLPGNGRRGPTLPAAAVAAEPSVLPQQVTGRPARRQTLLLLSSAAGGGATVTGIEPAHAQLFAKDTTKEVEVVRASGNPKQGTRPYVFEKPAGFRRLSNPIDPSGYLYRSTNDTYFTFVTRAEARANASTEFSPNDFIADYEMKFVNATGSSFQLIKGGPTPDRVDDELGVKYYEVEYVVRTQLGFTFDSLRSLHFLTVFAAAPESIYILNCQAQDDKWETDGPTLKKVASTFSIIG